MWQEWNPQHIDPHDGTSFSDQSGRRGSTTVGQEAEIQNNLFRSYASPRGIRKLGLMYMLWIPQVKAILLKTKGSLLPNTTSQLIYSQQVSPGTHKICYQTGNKKISTSSRRKGEEPHPYRDRKSADQDPSCAQGNDCFLLQSRELCKA